MKDKTGFEIFVLDTLPRWLMYVVGVMLIVLISSQVGIYKGREAALQQAQDELKAISNELRESEIKLKEMEEELEHQKLIKSIAMCESSLRHDGVWGDGGRSYGIFQFQHATFKELAGKMGFKNARWKDAGHQYIVADWAIRNGHGKLWTCYRKIKVITPSPLNSLSHKGRGDKDGELS